MGLESKVSNQMHSCSLFFLFKNTTPSWMALLALLLLFSSYLLLGFGYFPILYTSLVLVFSTLFYTLSKHKAVVEVDHQLVEEKVLSPPEERSSDQRENIASTPLCKNHHEEAVTKAAAKELAPEDVNCSATSAPDLISVSEFQEQFSSNSEESEEVDWPFSYAVDHSPDCSDGSISDEESLIEIALPSGHYVGQENKDIEAKYNNKCSLQQKKRDQLSSAAEALFSHQSLMEFLSELNDVSEEENLIEIDISMGSIKYSRFEIKA